jgi:hypothetical protein
VAAGGSRPSAVLPLVASGAFPVGPVGHGRGERGLLFSVGVVQRLVARGQGLVPAGLLVVGVAASADGFGGGAEGGQAGVPGSGAGLAEFVADPGWCPGGFGGVGAAQVEQSPVGHAVHVGSVGGAEGGEGLVPGGAQVRGAWRCCRSW